MTTVLLLTSASLLVAAIPTSAQILETGPCSTGHDITLEGVIECVAVPCPDGQECYDMDAWAFWGWNCESDDRSGGYGDYWATDFYGHAEAGFTHSHAADVTGDGFADADGESDDDDPAFDQPYDDHYDAGGYAGADGWSYTWYGSRGDRTDTGSLDATSSASGTSTEVKTYGQSASDYSAAGRMIVQCTTGDNSDNVGGPTGGEFPPGAFANGECVTTFSEFVRDEQGKLRFDIVYTCVDEAGNMVTETVSLLRSSK